tara:strand:- start:29 stop:1171 length:1143 start_codon:yes stop_codon:yes gene_type:complete
MITLILNSCHTATPIFEGHFYAKEKERVVQLANAYIALKPITVVASIAPRSAGGIHDFYSEGDYWWPDPQQPKGPYIRKDGLTNPDNFVAHREAMIRFSQISGALSCAYILTHHKKYAEKVAMHLRAWFIDEQTLMNPNLRYGQAIMGRFEGRGIGIIDTIHLIEVAQSVTAIADAGVLSEVELKTIKQWFSTYLKWMTTHPYGIAERDNGNNHSVCWVMQVAVFADVVGDEKLKSYCIKMYKEVVLPHQMQENGSFPQELARTKPYGYSLFTLDAMTTICQVLSTPEDNLFTYQTPDGKSIAKGISFMYPYTKNKNTWPYQKDVMYWNEWPVRHSFLLFGGIALGNDAYLNLWNSLDADFDTFEVLRNMPIRFPLLWLH